MGDTNTQVQPQGLIQQILYAIGQGAGTIGKELNIVGNTVAGGYPQFQQRVNEGGQNWQQGANAALNLLGGGFQSMQNPQSAQASTNPIEDVKKQLMQKSATKTLSQYFDQHAQDALMQPGGIDALSYTIAQSQQPQGQPAQSSQSNNPTPQPQQGGQPGLNVNKGSMMGLGGASMNPQGGVDVNMPGPVGQFMFGNNLVNRDLATLGAAQKVAGEEKIQPLQKQERQAAIYSAQIGAYNDAIAKEENMQKGMKDQLDVLQKSNPMVAITGPGHDQWIQINKDMIESRKRALNANMQFGKLATNPPKVKRDISEGFNTTPGGNRYKILSK